MNYKETIGYLYSRLPMFHRVGAAALKPGLTNITTLCQGLGNPQKQFPAVHVAGTNGKGSTCNLLASVLQEAGYRTGLFTSPHLRDFRERIRINGEMIPEGRVTEFVEVFRDQFEQVEASFFEYSTAMAFWFFANEKVDIAVIETGLGGRLDSTNILEPVLSIITSISMDHSELLGDTVEKIAGEKAGIIKRKTPVVLAHNSPQVFAVIERFARANQAELFSSSGVRTDGFQPGLGGDYQVHNVAAVVKSVEVLKRLGWQISLEHLADGLRKVKQNTGFAGRWEELPGLPRTICDVAHNEDGLRWVFQQIKKVKYNRLHVVFGLVREKQLDAVLRLLPKEAVYYFTNADIPRAMPAGELRREALAAGLAGEAYPTVHEAVKAARSAAAEEDLIFIGGSVYVVAEVSP